MKKSHMLFCCLITLFFTFSLAAAPLSQSTGYEESDTATNFRRVVLHIDPLSACFGTVGLNIEGFISPDISCFVEGFYTFPLISEKMYQGSGGLRFYYDSTHFWGIVAKTGKYRLNIPSTKSDPNEYYYRMKYMSAGAFFGKNFTFRKRFNCTYRFGLCYPFKKETYWRSDRKPSGSRLTENLASITSYLDGELTLRIPLPF